jgi:hypothetical protein
MPLPEIAGGNPVLQDDRQPTILPAADGPRPDPGPPDPAGRPAAIRERPGPAAVLSKIGKIRQ